MSKKEKKKKKGVRFSAFKTNEVLEDEGVWIDFGAGMQLKVARLGNQKCQDLVARLQRPHLKKMRKGNLSQVEIDEIMRKAISECVLLGWENLLDEKDNPIPYSTEKAFELLGTKDFMSEVMGIAQDADNFRDEVQEDSLGN